MPTLFHASPVSHAVSSDAARISNELVAASFHAGDAWAEELVRRIAVPLGRALAMIHSAVGVERYVIIGGFANALGRRYLAFVAEAAAEAAWALGQDWPGMLELGSAADDAGLRGAGRLAARTMRPRRG
jgi:glucokinase